MFLPGTEIFNEELLEGLALVKSVDPTKGNIYGPGGEIFISGVLRFCSVIFGYFGPPGPPGPPGLVCSMVFHGFSWFFCRLLLILMILMILMILNSYCVEVGVQ